jgi:hypothetical protein
VIGTLFYLMFLASILRRPTARPDPDAIVCEAAGQAVLAGLSSALVSAAVYDMGIAYYAFAATASLAPVHMTSRAQRAPWSSASAPDPIRRHDTARPLL